jgi:DNA polymerase-3 subunit gamma/tau
MAKQSKATAPAAGEHRPAGYTVLARRYRSRDFDELIGQEPIARTLRNAIASNRTAHAYLFCGTRGVGKTSMARIFAKALNAIDELSEKDKIAAAILRGDDLDVIEIDGASYRGINEAKDLIAGAGLMPARSKYKIYIIDEVHQLTKDAFNALLKTMEEPPSHVKFILCTTEPHKVPATIQSRCQRFDFRPLSGAMIAQQLKKILKDEGIEAEPDVLAEVARLANGSMRDGLSLLDRLLAAGEEKLTGKLVEELLGVPDHALIANLIDAIQSADVPAALRAGDDLLKQGYTVEQALEALTEHLRAMMIIASCGEDSDLVEFTGELRAKLAAQASAYDAPAIVHMIALCESIGRQARMSTTSRALFDAAIVRLCMTDHLASIPALLRGEPDPTPQQPNLPPRLQAAGEKKNLHPGAQPDLRPQEPVKFAGGHAPHVELRPASAAAELKPSTAPPTESSSFVPAVATEVSDAAGAWDRIVQAARTPADQARIAQIHLLRFEGSTALLAFTPDATAFVRKQVDELKQQIRRALGAAIRVEFEASGSDVQPPASPERLREEVKKNPVVARAMDLFDADVIAVEEIPRQPAASPSAPLEGEQHV